LISFLNACFSDVTMLSIFTIFSEIESIVAFAGCLFSLQVYNVNDNTFIKRQCLKSSKNKFANKSLGSTDFFHFFYSYLKPITYVIGFFILLQLVPCFFSKWTDKI
jgi:hypothetical protein